MIPILWVNLTRNKVSFSLSLIHNVNKHVLTLQLFIMHIAMTSTVLNKEQ